MTFSKEESLEMGSSQLIDLDDRQRSVEQLKIKQIGDADDENELRVEDISSSSSCGTSSDESSFSNALNLGLDNQDKMRTKLPMIEQSLKLSAQESQKKHLKPSFNFSTSSPNGNSSYLGKVRQLNKSNSQNHESHQTMGCGLISGG